MSKKLKKIVCFGGGTGVSVVLSGLKEYDIDLSAIVTMFDNGGSSGKLKKELGILPLGDIRQCLATLSNNKELTPVFYYRFAEGKLKGHSLGNLVLAALAEVEGSLDKAIAKIAKILKVKAKIIPVTMAAADIVAVLKDKQKIKGEEEIVNCSAISRVGVQDLYLVPRVEASAAVLAAVAEADLIIFAPGKFYTSILPNLLVEGVKEAVNKSKAKKVFICNLMTQVGNTDNFSVTDFINIFESYLGSSLDLVIFNKEKLIAKKLKEVKQVFPEAKFIKYPKALLRDNKFIGADLLDKNIKKLNPADVLVNGANQRTMILHDPDKLAKIILKLCKPY